MLKTTMSNYTHNYFTCYVVMFSYLSERKKAVSASFQKFPNRAKLLHGRKALPSFSLLFSRRCSISCLARVASLDLSLFFKTYEEHVFLLWWLQVACQKTPFPRYCAATVAAQNSLFCSPLSHWHRK